jgi:hypothetical protein
MNEEIEKIKENINENLGQYYDEIKVLKDQIKYSTIKLNIYQRQTIKRELIANDKNIDAYEPGFGYKILEAIKTGWNSLETFLLFLMNLWGFFLFAIAIYFLYRKYKHKFK